MKTSGLADSPFFVNSASQEVFRPAAPSRSQSPIDHIRKLYEKPFEPMNGRTPERVNGRTDEQLHNRSDEPLNKRTPEHLNEHSSVQLNEGSTKPLERPIHRQSYDIYDDQTEAIEALCLKWRKERRKHITKGEAMRELLDEILASKR